MVSSELLSRELVKFDIVRPPADLSAHSRASQRYARWFMASLSSVDEEDDYKMGLHVVRSSFLVVGVNRSLQKGMASRSHNVTGA